MAQGFLLNQRTRKNYIEATGGDSVTTYEVGGVKYKLHTFTSSGTFTVTDPGTDGIVEMLLVGGGGGGGSGVGGRGGGGGGQFLSASVQVEAQSYTVEVGGQASAGSNGNQTYIPELKLIAIGGGKGGAAGSGGTAGANGGGGGGQSNLPIGYPAGGSSYITPVGTGGGEGRNDGNPGGTFRQGGGGGGGNVNAGTRSNVNTGNPGAGGAGSPSFIVDGVTEVFYGGGGGGCGANPQNQCASPGVGGSLNSYGGGGRAGQSSGQGVVYIRYETI